MKITAVETFWHDEHPNVLWVHVHTDDGLIGLGETFYAPRAVSSLIHDVLSRLLLGHSAFDIERLWNAMFATVDFFGHSGAEMRAISAIDIALHDLVGQYLGQPVYNIIGGRTHDSIQVYNTCVSHGPHDDYQRWRYGSVEELAEELLATGITAMKIWPFDQFGSMLNNPIGKRAGAEAVGPTTHTLSRTDLDKGVEYVARIRKRLGDRMAIAIEGHGRWNLPEAVRIAKALAPYDVMWFEDLLQSGNPAAWRTLKEESGGRICGSERVLTRFGMRPFIETAAVDIVMPDIVWTGGLTEMRKICSHADMYHLPIATHDTVGPIALHSAAHLMHTLPNAMIMETVRAYCEGWYREAMTHPVEIRNGRISLPERPGLGTALRSEFLRQMHTERTDELFDPSHAKG